MPKVPQYQESQGFGTMPGVRFAVDGRALSSALGGETWDAVSRAGERMRAVGGQAGGVALDEMRRHNEAVAMARLTTAESAILDIQAEQERRNGADALSDENGTNAGVLDSLRTGLSALRTTLTRDLNPAQRHLFDLGFRGREQGVMRWGATHEARQREAWQTGAEDDLLSAQARRALERCGELDQVDAALGNTLFAVERRGRRLGLTPEEMEAQRTEASRTLLLPVFQTLIARGELDQAQACLQRFGGELGDENAARVQARIQSRAHARTEALAAGAEADRNRAEAEAVRASVREEVANILVDVADFPGPEAQKRAALARADALADPATRDAARAEIAREMAWRQTKQDAEDVRAALDFFERTREDASPALRRERLDAADLSERARELVAAWEREPDEAADEAELAHARTMTLLRSVDQGRRQGRAPTENEILAACLHGGLSAGQTRMALTYAGEGGPLSVSRLDDVCLDLGLSPDRRGRAEAPAWLYAGVVEDLSRNGLLDEGKALNDETLERSVTRVWRRRQAALAARGPEVENAAGVEGFEPYRAGAFLQPRLTTPEELEQRPPAPPPSPDDLFRYGLQDSVSGLAARGKLPDILTPRDLEHLGLVDQLVLSTGRTLGDSPALAFGAGLGALGGPVAPFTVPLGAMGVTEGTRAALENQIRYGTPRNLDEFVNRAGDNLTATAKGMAIGGATGLAGLGAGTAVRAAGGGALSQTAGKVAAETATLPTAAAAVEGRLPEARDFADAALMVLGGRAAGKAYRASEAEARAVTWALRDMYAKQGLSPRQAAEILLKDPSGRSEKLLEEGRRHTRMQAERRARGKPDRVPPTDFTDYRSAEHMTMLRSRLKSIRPEERDFVKTLKPKDAGSQAVVYHKANNLRRDLGVETTPVEVEPGRWALRVDKVPPPPSPEELRPQLRALYQAMKRGEACPALELGVVGPEEAARIRRCTGQDVLLEKRVLRLRDTAHAEERHGNERTKGQGDLREEDFLRYAEIVLDPDWIEKGNKLGSLVYMRRYADGTVYAVEQNKSGKRLEGRTMWRALPGARPEIVLGVPDDGENGEEGKE